MAMHKRIFANHPNSIMTKENAPLIAIILSFFAIYIIWGSTYLFVAYAVEEIPPLKMAAVRFLLASFIILIFSPLLIKWKEVKKAEIKNAMIAGFMFLTLGNGAMTYALQFIDSGFSALIISAQPLVLLFMMKAINGTPIKPKAMIGVGLGILGMYLLISQQGITSGPDQWKGLLAIISCLFTWGYASMYVSKVEMPKSIFVNSAIQMLFSGFSLIIISFLFREPTVNWLELKPISIFSVLYLVIFGSIMAFTAFNYLLKFISPEKVSTSTYINPIVALMLGWYFRDELVTMQSVIAAGILLTGVYFINSNKVKKKAAV